jgi:cysteine-rich repeat protein
MRIRRTFVSGSVLLLCASLALDASAEAARYVRQRTLTSPTSQHGFGHALATVGSNLAVGDNTDDTGGGGVHGSVFLFDGTTVDLLRYVPSPVLGSFYFGTAIADYGGNLLVGSPGAEQVNGFTAYIIDANTGALLAPIRDPNPRNPISPSRGFGSAVATAGSRVLIGAPGDNPVGYPNQGSASLIDPFGSPGGALIFNLANPQPQANSYFGSALAVLGARLIVGAPFGNFTGGAVYEFDGSTGALLHTILPPLGEGSLGRALAVDASTLFASGLQVYRFAADGTLLRTYTNPSAQPFDGFGNALAVSGPLLLVGAQDTDGGGNSDAGAAHLFDVASGTLLQTLPNPEPGQSVHFGNSVAIVGKYLAIGSPSATGSRVLVYAPCGDDVVDPIEECDDGNLVDGDGCDSNCRPTGCGNGVVTAGEQCDDGNAVAGDGCRPDCTIEACGDGILDPQEQCDDGNQVDGDGCDITCRPTGCGNGHVTSGEQCDDGNTAGGDCCSAICAFEPSGSPCFAPGYPAGSCDGAGTCIGYAIPTLSEWGVLFLSTAMLLLVLRHRRLAAGRR